MHLCKASTVAGEKHGGVKKFCKAGAAAAACCAGHLINHSSLEGVKIENKLTGAGINAKNCKNTSPVTTKNFKIGQRGNPELWPILSFFTYFMVGWVGVPT